MVVGFFITLLAVAVALALVMPWFEENRRREHPGVAAIRHVQRAERVMQESAAWRLQRSMVHHQRLSGEMRFFYGLLARMAAESQDDQQPTPPDIDALVSHAEEIRVAHDYYLQHGDPVMLLDAQKKLRGQT